MNWRWITFSVLSVATIIKLDYSTNALIYAIICILVMGFLFLMFYIHDLIDEVKNLNKRSGE